MSAKGLSTLGLRRMREGITHSVCSDIRVQTEWVDAAAKGSGQQVHTAGLPSGHRQLGGTATASIHGIEFAGSFRGRQRPQCRDH